jgi:hypothetical protein
VSIIIPKMAARVIFIPNSFIKYKSILAWIIFSNDSGHIMNFTNYLSLYCVIL